MKNKRAFTLVEVAIVVVIIGLLAAMAVPAYNAIRTNNSAESYRVWCKLHKRDDITFEEWKAAKRAGLLAPPPAAAPAPTVTHQTRFR